VKPALAPDELTLLALVEEARKEWPPLAATGGDAWEQALLGPVREFLRRPGKAFRAQLVDAAWRVAGGAPGQIPKALPLVVELIHAGSLIIDDIEDGSDERRGAPALHRIYGTPAALNAGNWLYFFPLRLISRLGLDAPVELALLRRATATLARRHEGQALDLAIRVDGLSQRDILPVVIAATDLKTGSLMELAAASGAEAAGADPLVVTALAAFGRQLGIGLQMLDDVGGLLCERRCAKAVEDLCAARPTWPWAWLAEDLDQVSFAALQQQARQIQGEPDARRLAGAMREALAGQARLRVRSHLAKAMSALRDQVGDVPALTALEREIDRLEGAYG